MRILKLDAIDSTNTYLKNLAKRTEVDDFTTVVTRHQTKGKGQMGATWEAEPDKNLTFSTLKKFNSLTAANAFLLNICASLAILNTLKQFSIPNLHVKWPNDILSGNEKICGILIENMLVGKHIKTALVGIGLNVNQTMFNTVSNVTSMKLLLGTTFNLDEVHKTIMAELSELFFFMEEKNFDSLWVMYEEVLFRKDQPSKFKKKEGELFTGLIRGVSSEGRLCVELENAVFAEFDLKQIQLIY